MIQRVTPALLLVWMGYAYFFVTTQEGKFGAEACHLVRHGGSRVLSTATVTLCHREECFSLFHSTLLDGDRAPRGRSLLQKEKRKIRDILKNRLRSLASKTSSAPFHNTFSYLFSYFYFLQDTTLAFWSRADSS